MSQRSLIVIGGGAAGFFCAINAARKHAALRVTLLERSAKLLSKVRISGGGRCNVTHACFDIAEMSRHYPRGEKFVKKAFHQFFTTDTIKWFEDRNVKLKTETDGRMFPVTDRSETIVQCLLNEASKYHIDVKTHVNVIRAEATTEGFTISTSEGQTLKSDLLCIACGGFPKKEMFNWIRELGHDVIDPVPSLFTFNLPSEPVTQLMGISVPVRARIQGTSLEQEGPLLITHWGLSGPAILKLSAWGARELEARKWEFTVRVNWLPEYNEQSLSDQLGVMRFNQAAQKIRTGAFGMPQRLWAYIVDSVGVNASSRWADISSKQQHLLARALTAMEFHVKGKTTFREEFVTAGGIRLSEVDPQTMMSRKLKGLYFAGEILDVDGVTGGFNFQHAWTSGFIAAQLK